MEKLSNSLNSIQDSREEIDFSLLGLRVINALQRSLKLFVSIVAMGAFIGLFYYYLTPPVYDTSLIASSKILTNVRVENLIEVLDDLAKENNSSELSKKLHISPLLAKSIKSIEAESIIPEKNVTDKTAELDNNVFEITLSTSNNQRLDSLQAGILYYLQNNDFVQKRTAIQKQNLETMRERVQQEVGKLDSLRFSVNKLIAEGVGNNSTILMSDLGSINKDIIALYERELNINSELLLINDIQVIQDFTQFANPASPKLLKSVAASTGSAITLALIIIAILEARRGMRRLKQELEQKVIKDKELV